MSNSFSQSLNDNHFNLSVLIMLWLFLNSTQQQAIVYLYSTNLGHEFFE